MNTISETSNLNKIVDSNFAKVKLWFTLPLLLIFIAFWCYIFSLEGNYIDNYIAIQKDLFFKINKLLGAYPILEYNLTELGDVIIIYPLISVFIIKAPKLWNALLISSLLSLVIAFTLKMLFSIPRPAAIFDNTLFIITGDTLKGHTSHPSGHSITTFIIISILLFAFMPKEKFRKLIWCLFMVIIGLCIVSSRVAVGAHYPIDVIAGSLIGTIIVVIGINIYNLKHWKIFDNPKYRPIFVGVLLLWSIILVIKIITKGLFIHYISLFSLIITLWILINSLNLKKK